MQEHESLKQHMKQTKAHRWGMSSLSAQPASKTTDGVPRKARQNSVNQRSAGQKGSGQVRGGDLAQLNLADFSVMPSPEGQKKGSELRTNVRMTSLNKSKTVSESALQDLDFNLLDDLDFSLDDGLDVVSEASWNYDDFPKDDARWYTARIAPQKDISISSVIPYVVMVALVVLVALWYFVWRTPSTDYDEYKAMVDGGATYIEGEDATSEEYIDIGSMFQEYTHTLQQGTFVGYDKYCVDGNSALMKSYATYVKGVKSAYDDYDSNAKALKLLSMSLQFGVVDKVVKKDDSYFAYVQVVQPTKNSLREYVNLHKYRAAKEFNGMSVTLNDLGRFLIETMMVNKVICSTDVLCIELKKINGTFKLFSDTDLLNICTNGYNFAVEQLAGMISSTASIR